jgi:hypothetical protein
MDGHGNNEEHYSSFNDLNILELRIINNLTSTISNVRGFAKEGKISLGGRVGEEIINHEKGSIGSWNKQGVDSYMHHSANPHPYGDFYFTDFSPRVHKDDPMDGNTKLTADLPDYLKYKDGTYEIFPTLTNIREEIIHHSGVSINIDNFQPFLKEVNIHLNGIQVYHLAWVPDECGGMKYVGGALFDNLGTLSTLILVHLPLFDARGIPSRYASFVYISYPRRCHVSKPALN